ncbi:hypothetical protein D0863_12452 [Hortaea werneckii]|uniref:DNL-type domain-containing protein n=1 Tax=Hortaea werneckii TaxID=91943 RepID=A0A3M7D1R9_HORWE|nr:hypothetical protein D0863_12452 [Hortaea werneckii]
MQPSRTIQRAAAQLLRSRNVNAPRYSPTQATRSLHAPTPASPSLLRTRIARRPALYHVNQIRCESSSSSSSSSPSSSAPRPLTDSEPNPQDPEEIAARKAQEPAYEMTFTCRACLERSSHRITKQAYHFGTTLITCPGCKNRHLISDHLKIFSDKNITLEDILKEKGRYLKKGRLGEDGDIEFFDEKQTGQV